MRRLRGRKFCEDVMSILPPPTTGRLRREDRKELRVCVCSNEVGDVVIISEPVSWTYEYSINSVFVGGKVDENAVRGGIRNLVSGGGWPSPI